MRLFEADTWQDALTRRLRTLIRTAPLHRVEASKAHRADIFAEQDLRALALRALDIVIEQMGLGTGATMFDVVQGLEPLIVTANPTLDAAAIATIAEAVVLALLNETERRQAFVEEYLFVGPEGTSRRVLQFHLLRERETADGNTVIMATVEGINLYAGMLDYPVEDAQIAEEAVLQAQVQRGRIADAVRTAQRARLRSIELEQTILGLLERVRRDIRRIDWVTEVLTLLDTARTHVRERLDVELDIRRAVEKRIDAVFDETGAQLVALRDVLDECIRRHTRLHERLIGANREYLEEQERQAFRPRAAARLPDLESDVLRRAVALLTGELAALAPALLVRFHAPRRPIALRLTQLVDRLLAPRREAADEPTDTSAPDLELLDEPARHFNPEDEAAVDALLAEAPYPTTLGELVGLCERGGLPITATRLLGLRVLRAFDPRAKRRDALRVDARGRWLETDVLCGDDLTIDRQAEAPK